MKGIYILFQSRNRESSNFNSARKEIPCHVVRRFNLVIENLLISTQRTPRDQTADKRIVSIS